MLLWVADLGTMGYYVLLWATALDSMGAVRHYGPLLRATATGIIGNFGLLLRIL